MNLDNDGEDSSSSCDSRYSGESILPPPPLLSRPYPNAYDPDLKLEPERASICDIDPNAMSQEDTDACSGCKESDDISYAPFSPKYAPSDEPPPPENPTTTTTTNGSSSGGDGGGGGGVVVVSASSDFRRVSSLGSSCESTIDFSIDEDATLIARGSRSFTRPTSMVARRIYGEEYRIPSSLDVEPQSRDMRLDQPIYESSIQQSYQLSYQKQQQQQQQQPHGLSEDQQRRPDGNINRSRFMYPTPTNRAYCRYRLDAFAIPTLCDQCLSPRCICDYGRDASVLPR